MDARARCLAVPVAVLLGVGSGFALTACGGGPETVIENPPVVTTTTPTTTDIQVMTETDTVTDDGGGYDQGAGTCPPGEVLSAPGNKCRPGDDSDDGQ
jgi:hypothetical protein